MKKTLILLAALLFSTMYTSARRVVFVTVDGYRWQELFSGADSLQIGNNEQLKANYWKTTAEERRSLLMPFTWSEIARNGLMIGNRWKGCRMQVKNKMQFSYPGYNELLCGHPDDEQINTNNPVWNPNVSILEIANNTDRYKGKVLIFASWDRFIHILNEQRSHLEINTGYRHSLSPNPTERERLVEKMQDAAPRFWEHERADVFTHEYAIEAMKSRKPELIYIGYGDIDELAHMGDYRLYLEGARTFDNFLKEIWEYIQSDPFYKDQTTLIITCDHGRGCGKVKADDWRDHGTNTTGSGETWFMAIGKTYPPWERYPVTDSITTIRLQQLLPISCKSLLRPNTHRLERKWNSNTKIRTDEKDNHGCHTSLHGNIWHASTDAEIQQQ